MASGVDDVIAYLEQRLEAYRKKCGKDISVAAALRPRLREVEVILYDLKAGLHEGCSQQEAGE